MADQNDDINLKKAEQSAQYALMEQKMQEYRQKLIDMQNRIYQGKYQGVILKMKGDFNLIETTIDQNYYETASKAQLEKAILVCFTNLHSAIEQETKAITEQMQSEMSRFQLGQMPH